MVAMAVPPRWGEGREMVDELQRGEGQRRGAIVLGFRLAVEDVLLVKHLETLEREQRARRGGRGPRR